LEENKRRGGRRKSVLMIWKRKEGLNRFFRRMGLKKHWCPDAGEVIGERSKRRKPKDTNS